MMQRSVTVVHQNRFRVARSNVVGPLEWIVHLAALSWWEQQRVHPTSHLLHRYYCHSDECPRL